MKKWIVAAGFVALACAPLTVGAEEDTELYKQMEAMDDAYKAFRKETDPTKGAALAREAQGWALKSFGEVPELVKAIKDPVEKAKAEATYRKMVAKLIVSLCEVEEAFVAGKLEDVEKIVTALKEQKKEGHEKFMPE